MEISRYFYKANGDILLESCKVKSVELLGRTVPVRIGSFTCQSCEHCIEVSNSENWVLCDIINEAK